MSNDQISRQDEDKQTKSPSPWLLLFFVVALYFTLKGLGDLRAWFTSKDWLSVTGKVLHSEISLGYFDGNTIYNLEVVYEYSVSEITYTNNRIRFGGKTDYYEEASALNAMKVYTYDDAVIVYYNPKHPADSVLDRGGFVPFNTLMGILGLVLTATQIPKIIRNLSHNHENRSDDSV